MTVFATLFGKLAQNMSSGKDARVQMRENSPGVTELLSSHVGMVPNPLSERSKHLTPRIEGAAGGYCP